MVNEPLGWTSNLQRKVIPMQSDIEAFQSVPQATGSAEPSHPWILGLVATTDGPRAPYAPSPDSFMSECECPDDCLRDHENE